MSHSYDLDDLEKELTITKPKEEIFEFKSELTPLEEHYVTHLVYNDEFIPESAFSNGDILVKKYLSKMIDNSEISGGIIIDNSINNLYVIGDIHGDFFLMETILSELTKCVTKIDNVLKWIAENTYVVFCGDLIHNSRKKVTVDDQNSDLKIITQIKILDEEAKKFNSRVLFIVGNHEMLELKYSTLIHPSMYTSRVTPYHKFKSQRKSYVSDMSSYDKRMYDWSLGSEWGKWYAKNAYISVMINNVICSHSGMVLDNMVTYPELTDNSIYNIQYLNYALYELLYIWNIEKNRIKATENMDFLIDILHSRVLGNKFNASSDEKQNFLCRSYFEWFNKFVYNSVSLISSQYKENFNRYIKGDIISVSGHNVQFIGVNALCNRKLLRIDVGMSSAFDVHKSKLTHELRKFDIKQKYTFLELLNLLQTKLKRKNITKEMIEYGLVDIKTYSKYESILRRIRKKIKITTTTLRKIMESLQSQSNVAFSKFKKPTCIIFKNSGISNGFKFYIPSQLHLESYVSTERLLKIGKTNALKNNIVSILKSSIVDYILRSKLYQDVKKMLINDMISEIHKNLEEYLTTIRTDPIINQDFLQLFNFTNTMYGGNGNASTTKDKYNTYNFIADTYSLFLNKISFFG